MKIKIIGAGLIALVLAGCASVPLPPAMRVTDISTLAGTYSGELKQVNFMDRKTRLTIQPNGGFELTASGDFGFRTLGVMTLAPDGTVLYRYDELKATGVMLTGKAAVYEGGGRRVLVLTHDDGNSTNTVSKSLP